MYLLVDIIIPMIIYVIPASEQNYCHSKIRYLAWYRSDYITLYRFVTQFKGIKVLDAQHL